MKRFHVHMGVENLDESVRFYSALFGTPPTKAKPDYAQWLLNDPHVNFAISTRAKTKGVDHFGIQVDDETELAAMREEFQNSYLATVEEGETVCCYARSEKSWVHDPSGMPWEAYRTMDEARVFSGEVSACCTPESRAEAPCCEASKTAACCA